MASSGDIANPYYSDIKIASMVNEPRTYDYDLRVWNVVNHLDVSNRVGPLWNCDLKCIVSCKGYRIVSRSVNKTQMSRRFLDEVIERDQGLWCKNF